MMIGYIDEYSSVVPLCIFSEESSNVLRTPSITDTDELPTDFVHDEQNPSIYKPADCKIIHILNHQIITLSARQVGGGQGLGNPHGEHCEDVYTIEIKQFIDEVGPEYMKKLNVPLRVDRIS
ncbi:hypothetical protein TrLO_g345 [Triparma laevis f. longispina]|uniref:Uncharacterized protein n=1 Tax=Triparma laevis f. longispina TaxID=1714387 RepID=A0A9W7F9L7_9STRA|nr:hypothetical protein TrLO_g345 [Triparma laevis f. longispina]